MIRSRDDLKAYLEADGAASRRRWKDVLGNEIQRFQVLMRKAEYYTNCRTGAFGRLIARWYRLRMHRRGVRLGFSIPINVFGPGLSIAHHGSIAVSDDARVGANCRLHVGVNIGVFGDPPGAPRIGRNVYIGPGAKLYGDIRIADGIAVGANAVVNRSFLEAGITIAGVPARKVSHKGSAGAGWPPPERRPAATPGCGSAAPDPPERFAARSRAVETD